MTLFAISHWKEKVLRPLVWAGYILGAIGFALWYRFFGYGASVPTLEGLQIVAAVGIGLSMQPPLIGCQAAMPLKEVASVTAVFSLARPLGCAIGRSSLVLFFRQDKLIRSGVAVFEAILNAGIRSRFALIPGYGTTFFAPTGIEGYTALHGIPDVAVREAVLTAFADSMKVGESPASLIVTKGATLFGERTF